MYLQHPYWLEVDDILVLAKTCGERGHAHPERK